MAEPAAKHVSNAVMEEYDRRHYEIEMEVASEVAKVRRILFKKGRNAPVSTNLFGELVRATKGRAAELFVHALIETVNGRANFIDDLLLELDQAYEAYARDIKAMDEAIRRMVGTKIGRWSRVTTYREKDMQLRKVIANTNDIRILLDAHDLAEVKHIKLDFVTGDHNDIGSNARTIMVFLTINSIVPLGKYKLTL